jgi:mRNA interferase RelE/StbE
VANYKLFISKKAEKALNLLSKRDRKRILETIQLLAGNPMPMGCRKLSGEENLFRIRVGVYRVIYEIKNKLLTVLILKVGHRRDIYRNPTRQ